MPRATTRICLNMIVKNEVKVLPRLIRSVKDYIDYYVIVDTGSTDDTIELIRREMVAVWEPREPPMAVDIGHGANWLEAK